MIISTNLDKLNSINYIKKKPEFYCYSDEYSPPSYGIGEYGDYFLNSLSGKLMCKGGDEILFTNDDRKRLNQIVIKCNRKFNFPKISSDPYSESHEKFGCGAGINHAYISAYGDLFPCDFLPIPFGNIRETTVKELWENMSNTLKKPQRICLAQVINKKIRDNKIINPKDILESIDVCKQHQFKELPGIYNKMKGVTKYAI